MNSDSDFHKECRQMFVACTSIMCKQLLDEKSEWKAAISPYFCYHEPWRGSHW